MTTIAFLGKYHPRVYTAHTDAVRQAHESRIAEWLMSFADPDPANYAQPTACLLTPGRVGYEALCVRLALVMPHIHAIRVYSRAMDDSGLPLGLDEKELASRKVHHIVLEPWAGLEEHLNENADVLAVHGTGDLLVPARDRRARYVFFR